MKKSNLLLSLISILILLLYFACKKEVLELDDIENGETQDVLSFKKNGNIWKPRDPKIFNNQELHYSFNLTDTFPNRGNFSIDAERIIKDDSLDCIVCDYFSLYSNVIDTGTFSIIEGGIDGISSSPCEFTQISFSIFDSTFNNFIKVIEIDTVKNAAAGYFQFSTIDTLCNDTVSITEGRFRLGFQ